MLMDSENDHIGEPSMSRQTLLRLFLKEKVIVAINLLLIFVVDVNDGADDSMKLMTTTMMMMTQPLASRMADHE